MHEAKNKITLGTLHSKTQDMCTCV